MGQSLQQAQVEVTDGWYSTRARLDEMLTRMLREDMLRIGALQVLALHLAA